MPRNRLIEDEAIEKPFELSQFRRLLSYLKPYRKDMSLAFFLMIVASAASLAGPFLIMLFIDDYISQANFAGSWWVLLSYFAVCSISAICLRYRVRIMDVAGRKAIAKLRQDLFDHIQSLSFSFFDDKPAGKIMVRVINDVNSLNDLFTNGIINVLIDIMTLFLIAFLMFSLHSQLTLAAMAALPLIIGVIFITKKYIRIRWQIVRRKISNMNAYLHESFAGIRVTQAFVREEENCEVFDEINKDAKNSWLRAVKINNIFWPGLDLASSIGVVLVYFYGIRLMQADMLTLGTLMAILWYLGRFWEPLNNISNFYNSILVAMASTERIFEILDTQADIKDSTKAIEMPPIKGHVQFKDVVFGYDSNTTVLQNVNFTVAPGETIALVGPTGAGKTTIVNLISRFYEATSGNVLIDGIDVKDATLSSLRSQMGIMMQDAFIFSGTIMDNIRYGKADATDEQVIEAAKAVSAHEFISKMEKGYDTEVNERGSRLSTGQKQLISFARTILKNPTILILDEATSSIDTQTEALIQKALDTLLKGRTSFVIAHRLSTIRKATRIMVIDDGNIKQVGNHNDLVKTPGIYQDLCLAQYRFLKEEEAIA